MRAMGRINRIVVLIELHNRVLAFLLKIETRRISVFFNRKCWLLGRQHEVADDLFQQCALDSQLI